MLIVISGLKGASVQARDGWAGIVKDFLFDDGTWRIRWMVVDVGSWLHGRKILIHPSAIAPVALPERSSSALPMMGAGEGATLSVALTRQQIEASPIMGQDERVSNRDEMLIYEYFGWDPSWGPSFLGEFMAPTRDTPKPVGAAASEAPVHPKVNDPHLRSAAAIRGYHVHASDGDIGHLENLIGDDINWEVHYLIVATSDWWPGKQVLLAPYAVQQFDGAARRIVLDVTRDQVKSSPPWDPATMIDELNEQRLHRHYGWPGYGWWRPARAP